MATTDHFGLRRLGPGDRLDADGWQFTDRDRVTMDRLLYLGAQGHHHDGAASAAPAATIASLTSTSTGGSIPAGQRVYYRVTIVDADGLEGEAGAEEFEDTPDPVLEPAAPTLTPTTAGGSLLPGQYFYVLTAWTTVNTNETKAISPALITVPAGTSTNRVVIGLPSLPAGATGFNVYRKKPGGARYDYLASVTGSGPTYTDTGAVAEDCNRTLPVRNLTNSTNRIEVELAETLTSGQTWRIYRSYVSGAWTNSLLHHVVEETSEGSGVITNSYFDAGLGTTTGSPPTSAQSGSSPDKIRLTDGDEAQGELPLARVSAFPQVVRLHLPGAVVAGPVEDVWVCEFPRAEVVGTRLALGRGSVPASQAVIVDVQAGSGDNPTLSSLFSASGDQPRVAVGKQVGARVAPTARHVLYEGDTVGWEVDQAGGGATPTDNDLVLMLYLMAHGYTGADSFLPTIDAFSPMGLRRWFKVASLFALADNAAISSWADLSTFADPATQGTAGNRPIVQTGGPGGSRMASFDGLDDFLKTSTFALAQPYTVFAVARNADSGATTRALFDGALSGAGSVGFGKLTTQWFARGGLVAPVGTRDQDWHIHHLVVDGASSEYHLDGGPDLLTADLGSAAIAGLTLGSFGNGTSGFWQGNLCELMLFGGLLPPYDPNVVGRYLASEYTMGWDDE